MDLGNFSPLPSAPWVCLGADRKHHVGRKLRVGRANMPSTPRPAADEAYIYNVHAEKVVRVPRAEWIYAWANLWAPCCSMRARPLRVLTADAHAGPITVGGSFTPSALRRFVHKHKHLFFFLSVYSLNAYSQRGLRTNTHINAHTTKLLDTYTSPTRWSPQRAAASPLWYRPRMRMSSSRVRNWFGIYGKDWTAAGVRQSSARTCLLAYLVRKRAFRTRPGKTAWFTISVFRVVVIFFALLRVTKFLVEI